MPNNYLFVTKDGVDSRSRVLPALEIITLRMKENAWPLYPDTNLKDKLQSGDNIYIYVGGYCSERGTVAFKAVVHEILDVSASRKIDSSSLMFVEKIVRFKDVERLQGVVYKDCLIKANKIKRDDLKWGAHLLGGIRRLDREFAEIYLRSEPSAT